MPDTAEAIYRQLGLIPIPKDALKAGSQARSWGSLQHGTPVHKEQPLFPRIETPAKAGGDVAQPSVDSVPQITIDEFQKIQLKVATVLSAERVPKSEKLIKLQVDLGGEQRQIVAGIGKKYEPESLVGRRLVIVANLKPATLMGVESQGMVLAAGDKEVGGLVTILEEVEPGTKVK